MEELQDEYIKSMLLDLEAKHWRKLKGNVKPGSKIEIKWENRENEDLGYCFIIPEQELSYDEGDVFLHVTNVDNSGGIGKAPDVWVHLHNLLTNDLVESVTFVKEEN